jgi:hypothetical protein
MLTSYIWIVILYDTFKYGKILRYCWYSPHSTRKSLRGGVGSGAVREEYVLVGELKGYYWCIAV